MTDPTADRPLTKIERVAKVARAAPEWIFRRIGIMGAPLLLATGMIMARISGTDTRAGAFGFAVAGLFGAVSVALAYNQGHDRGEAKRVTSTTVNMNVKLADGYAIVREEIPSHD